MLTDFIAACYVIVRRILYLLYASLFTFQNLVPERFDLSMIDGGVFLKDAAVAIIICGDESASNLWVEDCNIAAVTMQYAATSLGLGSRWFNIRGNEHKEGMSSRDYVAEIVDLPGNLDVECIIAVGYEGDKKVAGSFHLTC